MREIFVSDDYFFNLEVSFIMETRDKEKLLKLVKQKHSWEIQDNLSASTKRNDLLIWNVLYTQEIIKNGVSKQYLHPVYNKYYKSIQLLSSLAELQDIECKMIHSYFDILTHSLEAAGHTMVNKMISYLYLHIEDKIILSDMAAAVNLSIGYMCQCFKEALGMSIMNYNKKIKIERAQVLLTGTDYSILEIATLLGFCDQSNFCKAFKQITGMSPSKYRSLDCK